MLTEPADIEPEHRIPPSKTPRMAGGANPPAAPRDPAMSATADETPASSVSTTSRTVTTATTVALAETWTTPSLEDPTPTGMVVTATN